MIRSFLYFLWLAITVLIFAVTLLLASIFVRGRPLYNIAWVWLVQITWAARIIGGIKWQVEGMENVPKADNNEPVILAAKHQSTWETYALPAIMPHPLGYVFKQELLKIPFFGWAMGRLDMVHIDRSKRSEAWNKVAEQGMEYMAKGVWIIMFPEGTRTQRGSQGNYKAGATRLAVATGASIVPIAVTSAKCWPTKSFRLRPGTVHISIGKPMPSAGREPDEFMREIEQWIEGEMRRLTPEDYE